jgi:hypothetical protein
MAKVIGDVMYPSGKFIKDGEEMTRWLKVGILLETDRGMRIKLDAIPVVTGDSGLWMSVFEPRDQPRANPAPAAQAAPAASQDGQPDIPF